MRWIDSNYLNIKKNVIDMKEKDTTDVDVQCNLNMEVVKLIDLCILFVFFNEMIVIRDQVVFKIFYF